MLVKTNFIEKKRKIGQCGIEVVTNNQFRLFKLPLKLKIAKLQ